MVRPLVLDCQSMTPHSRRSLLQQAVGAWIAAAGVMDQAVFRAVAARAQSAAAPANLFDIERVAEDTYLALARPAAILNCNAAIFVNSHLPRNHGKARALRGECAFPL